MMKKVYVIIFLIFGTASSWAQIYVNTFTGSAACPTNGNTPTMALNSTGTPVTRSTVTCASLANFFSSTTLNATVSISNTSYIEFSATAGAGYQLNLTSVSFFRQGSNAAPNQLEVRYSTDGFLTSTTWGAAPLTPTAGTVLTWDFADFSTASGGTITFRIYPYGTQRCDLTAPAASTAGTFRVDDVTINGTVVVSGGSTINVTPSSLTGFTALSGIPSAEQNYSVDGTGLTANIAITPPTGFEISPSTAPFVPTSPITLTQSGGIVNSTTIYVRMNSATLGTNTGNISHTSTGANNPNVALTGHVITTEPTVQSAITIPGPTVTTTTMVVNFSGGNGAKRILVARSGSAVNSNPVDGITYTANANFASGTQIGVGNYVVYAGTGNTVIVTGLSPTTTYYFAVYEYNDAGIAGAENYLTVAPGTGNATTISTDGDYRSITSGNWSDIAIWQMRVSNLWVPAVIIPLPTSNVYIQAGHTVTVNIATATCNDLHINSAASSVLAIGLNTIEVNGKLRAFTGVAVTTLGADAAFYSGQASTTTVGGSCISSTAATGKMKVVGNTRIFTVTGEWGNNPQGWDIEFAPTAGQTLTIQTGFKAANITVASGTVLSTSTDIRPDGGIGLGSLTVKSGSTLQFSNNTIAIQRIGTAGATSHFGILTVESGATLEFSGTSSPVIGASVVNFNGTVIYSGTGNQTFAAKGGNSLAVDLPNYNNVTISGGGNKTLDVATTLSGVLNLISGYVISTTNLLKMTATSSVIGASNTSFVNGPVSKFGNTPFTFPVGKPNCGPSATVNGYVPIQISTFSAGTPADQYIAEYIRASAAALPGGITAVGLKKVSFCEYWTLDRLAGSGTVNVKLFWNEPINNCTTASPYIKVLSDLVVAHYNGTSWDSYGATSTAAGSTTSGDVTWPNASVFSPFTIGSISFSNPLPIIINYLNGTRSNGNHLLNWKATCVSVPSATIELERSSDGRNYSSIYSIFATALRCQQPFNYTDNQPLKGINYYRLKITDADGKETYSTIVPLLNAEKGIDMMNIAPNPVVNSAFNLKVSAATKEQMEILITDMQGRSVQKQSVSLFAGFNTISMNVKNLAAGTYQLVGNTSDGKTKVLRFVIQ